MAPVEHSRSHCVLCDAPLVYLAGDPTVPYEDINPLEGGPRTLIEHTDQRCQFHLFLTPPDPANHTSPDKPGPASQLRRPRLQRWIRTEL